MTMIPIGSLHAVLEDARGSLADAAQRIYDSWEQVDGFDEELGAGGICQDVASAMCESLRELGIEHATTVHSTIGENHVFVVALLPDEGIYMVDIPPSVYEIGSGYAWTKREGVRMSCDDVVLIRVTDSLPPEDFFAAYED